LKKTSKNSKFSVLIIEKGTLLTYADVTLKKFNKGQKELELENGTKINTDSCIYFAEDSNDIKQIEIEIKNWPETNDDKQNQIQKNKNPKKI